ncbi:MAG TPA: hypothetical protein VEG61_06125 [Candidatus Dormibacteraeota bacterium]|nr:hypothetical protein [Candidatus Dormibacteraeota bacterium]
MPQLPVIIPLIIIGISFGSLLKSEKPNISLKRITVWSLVAGLLNAVNAYAVYLLTPQPTFGGGTFAGSTFARSAAATSDISFTVASFLAGFIIVAAVFVIARVVSRRHQDDAELGEESESELSNEELSKLKPD